MILKLAFWLVMSFLKLVNLEKTYMLEVDPTFRMNLRDFCYFFEQRLFIFTLMIVCYSLMAIMCTFNIVFISVFKVSLKGMYYAACFAMTFIESIAKAKGRIHLVGPRSI